MAKRIPISFGPPPKGFAGKISAQNSSNKNEHASYKYIVAIDFGTTRSAIAWAVVDETKSKFGGAIDMNIESCYASSCEEKSLNVSEKSDTVLILEKEREKAFIGPQAFLDHKDDEISGWYATDFKMLLDLQERRKTEGDVRLKETKVPLVSLVEGVDEGKEKPIIEVISKYLEVAGEIGFQKIKKRASDSAIPEPKKHDIIWIITVPAIWTDQARIFMREAALKANLITDNVFSEQVNLCLEPEGAALYCFHHLFNNLVKKHGNLKDEIFMVIDLGGGTADITIHNISEYSNTLQMVTFDEIVPPSGGPWGGRVVNQAFEEEILKPVLGEHYKNYLANSTARMSFNIKSLNPLKNSFAADSDRLYLNLQPLLQEMNLQENFLTNNGKYNRRRGLCCSKEEVEHLFSRILNPLTEHLKKLVEKHKISFAFLVGGMGSNAYVYQQLKPLLQRFNIDMYQPPMAGLAVVLGAVRFGLNAGSFGIRMARTNYGIAIYNREDAKNSLFELLIKKHESLKELAKKTKEKPLGPYSPNNVTQTQISFQVYEAEESDVKYVTDKRCILITETTVSVNLGIPFSERDYTITLAMNGPVITGILRETSTGKETALKWSSR